MGCSITVTTAVKWWIVSHHYCLATDTAAPAVQVANGWTWTTADRLTQTQPTMRYGAAGKPVYLVTGVYPYVYPYHCWFCYSVDGCSIAVQTSAILLRIVVVHFTGSGTDSGSQSWCTLWRQTETAVAGFLAPLQVDCCDVVMTALQLEEREDEVSREGSRKSKPCLQYKYCYCQEEFLANCWSR